MPRINWRAAILLMIAGLGTTAVWVAIVWAIAKLLGAQL